ACVKHAASVRPEPGSNSPFDSGSHSQFSCILYSIGMVHTSFDEHNVSLIGDKGYDTTALRKTQPLF
ncbi:MAG: hypothetical protein RR370_02425, partial [Synergistaceae bacterium]